MLPGPVLVRRRGLRQQHLSTTPEGQIAVAPMPQWSGVDRASTGNVGGGTWLLSAH